MAGRAKGDQEILYFGPGQPCGGLDYSLPYNCLPPNSLADGTINTTQISGFVCSSPWIANSPYSTTFAVGEWIMGVFPYQFSVPGTSSSTPLSNFIIVTNKAVYSSLGASLVTLFPLVFTPGTLTVVHTWAVPEINTNYAVLGNAVSFQEVNGTLFFTGLMLNGIFSLNLSAGIGSFILATNYVCGAYIVELGGRLVVAQCRFPGGGGTGTNVLPTVAWSGPGQYSGSGGSDPWNPANGFGGGFNLLADVPDQITYIAGMGRSGIITRQNGISQMDPNTGGNSGLQPFNFYHLWASPQGVGAYKGSVAQFGYTLWFRSSDNVYSMNLYNGPQPIGQKIIAKIKVDEKSVRNNGSLSSNPGTLAGYWYFSSIIEVDGQLHYQLSLNAYATASTQELAVYTCQIYDYNVSENSWHIFSPNTYQQNNGSLSPTLVQSCPLAQGPELQGFFTIQLGSTVLVNISPDYIFFPYISSFGNFATYQASGALSQFVYWNYNFNSNPINGVVSALYSPLAFPVTNIVFRADIISLGHRTSNRRIRVQADNAPLPSFTSGSQQQAQASFTGSLPNNVTSSFLAWTQGAGPAQPVPYMQGNYQPQGAPMQTYYADMVLEDEMIQASIQGFVNDTANPWNSLPAFRISSVSLITMDPKSTTQ